MGGCFITGTDTGVGKTLVGGAIAGALVMSGKMVGVMKPFESGCALQGSTLVPEDALFLKKMANSVDDLETICPFRFEIPLAPMVAASIEKKMIECEKIKAILTELQKKHEVVLVEGAGGLMVPVADKYLMLDLILYLKLPIIIVSRLSLGTINHTLLTVRQAQDSGITVAGIILNQISPVYGKAEETNPHVIQKFSPIPVIGNMPFVPESRRGDVEYLSALGKKHIDLTVFS